MPTICFPAGKGIEIDNVANCYSIDFVSTVPLRIDTGLVNAARETAALMDRTPTAQIEFWAKLGRVMESCISHDCAKTLQRTARVPSVDELLAFAETPEARQKVRDEIASFQVPLYGADPNEPGIVIEIQPDGTERRGRFAHRKFTPLP